MPLSNKKLAPALFIFSFLFLLLSLAGCSKQDSFVKIPVNKEKGVASWYGPGFHGRKTANGERYNQNKLTAAHRKLPFGTMVKVINVDNMKSVIVRINDRGPYAGRRIIDLSRAAAKELDFVSKGTTNVLLFYLPEKEAQKEM